ncbi:MAG: hypothetical protein U0V70_17575 [Terriglobia bacterium]
MKVMAIDIRAISPQEQKEYGLAFAAGSKNSDEIISASDYVSLHLHLNQEAASHGRPPDWSDETRRVSDQCARGALVDESALYEALQEGRPRRGGDRRLYHEPATRIFPSPAPRDRTPHIAGATDGTSRLRAACAAENVDRIAPGQELPYRIDQ